MVGGLAKFYNFAYQFLAREPSFHSKIKMENKGQGGDSVDKSPDCQAW